MELTKENIKFALDIGTRSVIGSVGVVEDGKLRIIKECYKEHEERAMIDGQIHDIGLVAKVVSEVVNELQNEIGITLEKVSIAAAGRFLKTAKSSATMEVNKDETITKDVIRTLELMALKEAEKDVSKEMEGNLYCVGYSIVNYYLNGYLISNLLEHKGENIGVEIISTFLPNVVVESLYSVMNLCKLKVSNLTLEPIAAIEAVVPQNLRLLNIALVDIGAGTSDIAISSNQSISAYGMVPIAGDEVTEVIARECLVDFNTAEKIKRQINDNEIIEFIDVVGFENTRTSEELKEIIRPTVKKMADEISENILMLNGKKPPSAVFLVGGGAHTPTIIEELSKTINIPMQRIGIKDRAGITKCIADNNMGSAGVTVIGIAMIALKDNGQDFIDVYLNGEPVSLFNSFKHTVADVLVSADINPAMLIGKLGKNLKYTLNGKNKIVFGESGSNSVIEVNGEIASIETVIKEGDKINIKYAVNGKNAEVSLLSLIDEFNSKYFYVDGKMLNTEPVVIINNLVVHNILDYIVKDGDNIEIIYPESIKEIKKYILNSDDELYLNEEEVIDEYILGQGDQFTTFNSYIQEEVKDSLIEDENKEKVDREFSKSIIDTDDKYICINVNGKDIKLPNNNSNLFFEVFNYIDIDLDKVTNLVSLNLNGEKANYTDVLKDGDIVKISWD